MNHELILISLFSLIILNISLNVQFLNWKKILETIADKKIENSITKDLFFSANIGKYLPGNIMHFAGRNLIGKKYNIAQSSITITTFFEVICLVVAAVIISLLSGVKEFIDILLKFGEVHYLIIGVVVLAIIVYVLKKNEDKLSKYHISKEKAMRIFMINIPLNIIVLVCTSLSFVIVLNTVSSGGLGSKELISAITFFSIAWLIGFLTPGAPAGVGIREAVLIFLFNGKINDEIIISSLILHRLLSITMDFTKFSLLKITRKIKEKKNHEINNSDSMLQ